MPTLTMVGITNFRFSLKADLTVPHAVCFVPKPDVADTNKKNIFVIPLTLLLLVLNILQS